MKLSVKRLLGAAAAALIVGTTPALTFAQTTGGMLNPPAEKAAPAAAAEPGYTGDRIISALSAPKPEGMLKQVFDSGYTFMMPAVWELPKGSPQEALKELLGMKNSGQQLSGVAFLAFDGTANATGKESLDTASLLGEKISFGKGQILRAPIGQVTKVSASSGGSAPMRVTLYYPVGKIEWCVMAVTVGNDSAPTAEETAAYMVATLTKQ